MFISKESRKVIIDWKNRVIAALFQFYKSINYENYEGKLFMSKTKTI